MVHRILPRAWLMSLVMVATSACSDAARPVDLRYTTEDVTAAELPDFEPARLFRYTRAYTRADSLLRVLTAGGMSIAEAWEPIEDLCLGAGDPIGPRFTVVLKGAAGLIATFGFEPGNGIRPCTTRVRRYVIEP